MLATLRVRPENFLARVPEPRRMQEAAKALMARGIEVTYFGRYGLDVQVDEGQFVEVFGLEVPGPEGLSAEVTPLDAGLAEYFDRVEVIPSPTPLSC